MSRTDPQVNIRMNPNVLARLKAHAAETGETVTSLMNKILDASVPALPDQIVQVKVRLPSELHFKIQASAKRTNRSANAEIVHRLEKTFP